MNIKEVKKLKKEYPANVDGKIVEMIDFEEAEAEKLELVKRHMGLKQNKEVIKALICEKCDDIKLTEEKQRKQQIEDAKAMEYLEKGEYKCPM
jgi:long-subunit acyl-CoA synthetase (AMP-forming)